MVDLSPKLLASEKKATTTTTTTTTSLLLQNQVYQALEIAVLCPFIGLSDQSRQPKPVLNWTNICFANLVRGVR